MAKYYGKFTVAIEADTEEERDTLLEELGARLDKIVEEFPAADGFSDTQEKWEED